MGLTEEGEMAEVGKVDWGASWNGCESGILAGGDSQESKREVA